MFSSTTSSVSSAPAGNRQQMLSALQDASPVPYWLDTPDAPAPHPFLEGAAECDLAVVGGGYTGLWAALLAKERDPSRDVVLLDADRIGWQASGRNGGFCASTLTHGIRNGLKRFPEEIGRLEELGMANLDAIEHTVKTHCIVCGWERTGHLIVAQRPWEAADLEDLGAELKRVGHRIEWFDRDTIRAEVASPTYIAGLWAPDMIAMLDPARLAWGLALACERLGVRIHEQTPVTSLERDRSGVSLAFPTGVLRARCGLLATNAFRPLLRHLRYMVVPVYGYVLMSEPLTAAQREAIRWRGRQGIENSANQMIYSRLTADNRILWGGHAVNYHYGNGIRPAFEHRPENFARLADRFFATFPQLEGLRFTHAWAGIIDSCTRFCPFFGTALDGRVAYSLGYTGTGVGLARFGAQIALDLVDRRRTELTDLRLARSRPLPWPPEPLRWAAIQLTNRSWVKADSEGGHRNDWLRLLDRLGVGFGG